jgi:hypothetical protein
MATEEVEFSVSMQDKNDERVGLRIRAFVVP